MNIDWDGIVSIEEDGEAECYDITLLEDDCYIDEPNFVVDDVVVHNCGMHMAYIRRKKGEEPYEIHPKLKEALGFTYGVMAFQEQVMRVFHIVGDIPLKDCYDLIKAVSKKKEEVFGKYKEMFLVNGQRTMGWTLEQVQELWDQIFAFAEYGFNMSHSVSYAYNACRQLYLKAHYPLEFFATLLSVEDETDSIKEYKNEATKFHLEVLPVEINKSRVSFDVVDNKIYAGFSNIKGIGPEVAQRIVDGYPYASFDDFIQRFGAESNVLKPVCGLRLFRDASPAVLFEFGEHYKDQMKKRVDRDKRAMMTRAKHVANLQSLIPEGFMSVAEMEMFLIMAMGCKDEKDFRSGLVGPDGQEQIEGLDLELTWQVVKKCRQAEDELKKKQGKDAPISLADFRPKGDIDAKLKTLFEQDEEAAQDAYYGYCWTYLLERSPEYRGGRTFDFLVRACEEGEIDQLPNTEVHVIERPKEVKFRSGKGSRFLVRVQDARGREENIQFWKDDYDRFKEELEFWDERKGNLLSIKVKPPDPGFKEFAFESPPRHMRAKLLPKNKSDDGRLLVLARPSL